MSNKVAEQGRTSEKRIRTSGQTRMSKQGRRTRPSKQCSNKVSTKLEQGCEKHVKLTSKTSQKCVKNRPKTLQKNITKTRQPNFNQHCAQTGPKVTRKRPTREGKGGIQDGILLEKKRILQKPDLLRGKGACWKGKPQTFPRPTRSAGGLRPARGRIFRCFLVTFRRPFGQCWALLAPFGPLLAPC